MSEKQSVVFLKGRKVNLRPISKNDLPHIVRWINDPEVRLYLNAYLPQTEQDEEQWFEDLSKKKSSDIVLLIETVEGLPIGLMGIHQINWRDRVATTGALIGDKENWGKGYGTEAKILLLKYAFDTLNLRRICSQALAFNERSIRYSMRCGYKREGIFSQHIYRDGQYWDTVLLAVFRDDFVSVWEKYQKEKS